MWRLKPGVIQPRTRQRVGGLLKEETARCDKQWGAKSELSEVRYTGGRAWLKGAQVVKQSGISTVTAWSEDPLGYEKNRWYLNNAPFPGPGAGKPAENSESRCRVSALCCHKQQTAAQSSHRFPRSGPAKGRSVGRPSVEGTARSVPWESLKFGVLKLSCVPEIKTLSHRPREHRVLTETGETRVIDCSSVRTHWRVEDMNFQFQG